MAADGWYIYTGREAVPDYELVSASMNLSQSFGRGHSVDIQTSKWSNVMIVSKQLEDGHSLYALP
eukprot:scaffold3121_cov211-Skeletonema_marinoi.AAC.9